MKKSSDGKYWADRMVKLELNALKKGEEYYKNLQEQYEKAIHKINNDITVWYSRLAQNNAVNITDAMKKLNANELKEFKWTLEDYKQYGKENALNQEWMKELENASAKYHINHLQQIQLQMKAHLEELSYEQNEGMTNTLSDIYEDTYYHTAYEVQKGLNVGSSFEKVDKNRIEKVLNQGWIDGKNYSDRIWTNKDKLVNSLNTELTQMIMRGEAPDRTIKAISAAMGVSKRQAGRLVMTESAMIASASQKDCFKVLDVEEFEVVATLDMTTCEVCGGLDGIHLPMKQYKVGETAPPFHANCRCCTAPYFEDDEGTRIARNETGESYYVPSSMKYSEWKEKYVDNSGKSDIILPNYVRMNISNNFNPKNEVESINAAIMEMPKNIQKDLRNSTIEIFSKGQIVRDGKEAKYSFYDRDKDIIHIYQGANKSEVIHEIGHMMETKYKILSDSEYINIRNNGLENYSIYSVTDLKNYSNIKGIKNDKFISEQQGRIYKKDLKGNSYISKNQKINLNCLGEYFSEGFREYFENPKNLKSKDIDLFKYIERKLKPSDK